MTAVIAGSGHATVTSTRPGPGPGMPPSVGAQSGNCIIHLGYGPASGPPLARLLDHRISKGSRFTKKCPVRRRLGTIDIGHPVLFGQLSTDPNLP